jgi:carbonic anhydrase
LSFLAGTVALVTTVNPTRAADPAHPEQSSVLPAEAISRLKQGNGRFTSGNQQHPRQSTTQRVELANSQHPFAVIVGCADSRVPPEIVFDQGLGDLFVLRVAGNVIDDHSLGSTEYAVDHLAVRLIVVLGHQRCGAVKAAKETIAAKGKSRRISNRWSRRTRPRLKLLSMTISNCEGERQGCSASAAFVHAGPQTKSRFRRPSRGWRLLQSGHGGGHFS